MTRAMSDADLAAARAVAVAMLRLMQEHPDFERCGDPTDVAVLVMAAILLNERPEAREQVMRDVADAALKTTQVNSGIILP